MPNVQPTNSKQAVAVLVSDLHFSLNPPAARAGEPCWLTAMGKRLAWLEDLAMSHGVPIIAAGDIWDRSSPPASVINYIIDHCPIMYAIPGQHDLSSHVYENRGLGAYGTLVRTGTLIDLPVGELVEIGPKVYVQGFPWRADTDVTVSPKPGVIVIAAVHQYIHNGGHTCHIHATDEQAAVNLKGLKGFTVAHFGDNHTPFEYRAKSGQLVINTGGFYRRTADQLNHAPSAVVLFRNGDGVTYKRVYYDTSDEVMSREHIKAVSYAAADIMVDSFFSAVKSQGLETHTTDFRQYVRLFCESADMSPTVQNLLIEAVE